MDYGQELRATLPAGGLGQVLYAFDTVGSTNDVALELAGAGASEGTLVVADHQSRGRGRGGARWASPPGVSISMSVVLRPRRAGPRWAGLGALAIVEALAGRSIRAQVKWPNDVLLGGRKAAGVLVEAAWEADRLACLVVGIGVNVAVGSAPADRLVDFPATSIEDATGVRPSRPELVRGILESLGRWLPRVESRAFLAAWDRSLAFKGERVRIESPAGAREGTLLGLVGEGEVALRDDSGATVRSGAEAASLRPA